MPFSGNRLIFAVGAGVSIYEGIKHVLHPTTIENVTVNYIVLGLAMLFEGAAWLFALKEFTRVKGRMGYVEAAHRKDPTMFVVLCEDSAAMLGLIMAFFGILLSQLTGNAVLDGVDSVLIGVILGGTAVWLAIETKGLLIGEAADREVVRGIRQITAASPRVERVNEVLTMHMGPEFILVNISVAFRDELETGEVEKAAAYLDRAIKKKYAMVKRVFIEAESPATQRAVAEAEAPNSNSGIQGQ